MFGEYRALRRSGLLDAPPTDIGAGLPVLLIPGLLAPDLSLGLMSRFLARNGFRPRRAGIRSNVDCSEKEAERLERRLEQAFAEAADRPVVIVGHSRGGIFARVLAVRRPELVAAVVTLGSPLVDTLSGIHPFLHLQLELLARLGDRGSGRFMSHSCLDDGLLDQLQQTTVKSRMSRALVNALGDHEPGECCTGFWHDQRAPFPDDVRFVSIWSYSDGMVNPRSCHDPAAQAVRVRSSHCGMAWNPQVFRALLDELSSVAASPARARRASVPA
jgi:triacylglycerol lipase